MYEWSDDFKRARLREVSDKNARFLLYKLLAKDPEMRPKSFKDVLKHPFIAGGNPARMEGQEPEFDIFLSYRVNSEKEVVERLYNLLTATGLKVWWDKKCLKPG